MLYFCTVSFCNTLLPGLFLMWYLLLYPLLCRASYFCQQYKFSASVILLFTPVCPAESAPKHIRPETVLTHRVIGFFYC